MAEKQFEFHGFLDSAAEHNHTFEFRVVKPTFQIGQEVEIYYYRTKRWHRARVRSIYLGFGLGIGADYVQADAYNWQYSCTVLDPAISAVHFDASESSLGPKFSTIRAVDEEQST